VARARNRTSRGSSKKSNTAAQTQTQNNEPKEKKKMAGLTQEQIADILAGSRTRGAGPQVLTDFLENGEAGEEVDLSTGPLAGKEVQAAYTALTNARKRTKSNPDGSTSMANPEFGKIQVRKVNAGTKDAPDVHLFLINTELVNLED
jgi:hypothetical protein